MKIEEIEEKLIDQLLALLSVDQIDRTAELVSLGVESMALVEMFVFIEQAFGVDLMSVGLEREDLATVQTLAEAIARVV